jgi:hypothetical protein
LSTKVCNPALRCEDACHGPKVTGVRRDTNSDGFVHQSLKYRDA